jgi:CRP/FNR family transcriptional regulator, cyclic AMP receptor protein
VCYLICVVHQSAVDIKALQKLKPLSWLKPDQLKLISSSATSIKLPRGRSIFREGESSSSVYLLMSGVAKLSFLKGSERVLVGLVGPGEIFGVSSLLPEATRPFRCDAFSDCIVGVLEPRIFVETITGVPLENFSRTLDMTVGRWWGMLIRYANFVGLGLRERLAGALLELAVKFGVRDSRGTLLTLKLTHADLAELVGASRQRITEQLTDFEREQVIIRDGRRLILVPEKLYQIAESAHSD